MGKVILSSTRGMQQTGTVSSGSTEYFWLGTSVLEPENVEIRRQVTWRVPTTLSKLYVRVITNTINSGTTIVRIRKNGANGNQFVSIGAGSVGEFEDTVNTDSVVAGDEVNYQLVTSGTSGSIVINIISVISDSASNFVSRFVAEGYSTSIASTTEYLFIAGDRASVEDTESDARQVVRVAGTAKNAFLYVPTNGRTNNTVFTLRKNGVNTSVTITVGSGATGFFEDTVNTASFAVGDMISWGILKGSGTSTLDIETLAIDYETTTDGAIMAGTIGSGADIGLSSGTTTYMACGGGMKLDATELNHSMKARDIFTMSNLTVIVPSNSINNTTTIRLRKNGANSAIFITVGNGATGTFTDSVNTESFTANDTFNYQIVSAGSSGTLQLQQIAIWMTGVSLPTSLDATTVSSLIVTNKFITVVT